MKKNKKGFVLSETIAVSAVVVTALIILYVQFASINNSYNNSFKYNTVDNLYAVENIRNFILTENYDDIVTPLTNNSYVDITDCSAEYFIEYNYCKTLLNTLNVKKVIISYEDVTNLKNDLLQNNILSEGMLSFIKTFSSEKNNKYRLIVEFNNDTYATLKFGDFIISNISNECVKASNTCNLDQIKQGISLDVAVNDNETYNFNLLSDDGKTLTLIMNENINEAVWSTSISTGPLTLVEYLNATTNDWTNITDIIYNLNGTSSTNYNNCSSYNACESNTYTFNNINTKSRLPRLQELTNLGCTQTAGSCPSWLNIDSSGFWTSTTDGTKAWAFLSDNRVNNIDINTSIKLRPVITISKDIVK